MKRAHTPAIEANTGAYTEQISMWRHIRAFFYAWNVEINRKIILKRAPSKFGITCTWLDVATEIAHRFFSPQM